MLLQLAMVLAVSPPVETRPEVVRFTLDNGMRWLLVARSGAPRIGGVVVVHAGSVDEHPGATGAAHLLEHLAFAGTPFIGSNRGWRVEQPLHDAALDAIEALAKLEKQGQGASPAGRLLATKLVRLESDWEEKGDARAYSQLLWQRRISANAHTEKHMTTYLVDLPSSQLRFWLTTEAQRFAAPVLRGYRVARSVVVQELHDRSSNADAAEDALYSLAFPDSGQSWRTIGREADVRALAPSDVVDFHRRFYAPGNAVGCLVGDFDVAEAKSLIAQTFGALAAGPFEIHAEVHVAAPARKRLVAKTRGLFIAFPMPSRQQADWNLSLLAVHLLTPRPSVLDPRLRLSAVAMGPGVWAPHLVYFRLEVADDLSLADAENAWWQAVNTHVPGEEELEAIDARLALQNLDATTTRTGLANTLAEGELMNDRWDVLFERNEARPSLEDATRVMKAHFRREDAFVIEVERAR